jgi:chromosome segregation ATPase
MREARERLHEIQYEWDAATVARAELVVSYKEALNKVRKGYDAHQEAKIRLLEARSDVQGLKDHNSSVMERLDQEKNIVQEAIEEANRTKEAGKKLSEDVRDLLADNDDKRDLYTSLAEGKLPTELDREIDAEQANLELIHAANPNVIREFEKRAQEIARLQRKMASVNEKLAGLEAQLQEIKARWEPQLDALVSRINDAFAYNFEQISCAGEVRVHKADDFEQWAMDIMVRFR